MPVTLLPLPGGSEVLQLMNIKSFARLSFLSAILGILAFILLSHLYQISKGLLPLLPGFQTTKAHYLFGTLETANGSVFNTLGLSYADVAKKEHDAGIAVAQITIAWKDYEISDGVFNENLMASEARNINTFLQADQRVDVQLAVHYVPSWVM